MNNQNKRISTKSLMLLTPIFLAGSLFSQAIAAKGKNALSEQCMQDVNSAVCEAYLTGLVEGYVKSKKKYTSSEPAPNNEFLKRVYASRVSNEHLDSIKPEPACLPEVVNKQELVTSLMSKAKFAEKPIDQVLYDELQRRYGC
ncbi:hypothetical protein J1N51_04240 [Psychrosphaera ytuae]|uniref:Rap1a immunity protein domain-containing protein n=1 Tax=Psychrosphaera ytuae TaxID=2820710 RepID=A0A975DCZ8_9GAMM|nr:hypothetical protein [Psychrosphaera ytuae]QTH64684.1 hypothetical protein J1N51_04240 [Psychrosphaera ytuae]